MARPIGYYVYHHGEGHRRRALSIASCAPERFVLLGTGLAGRTDAIPVVDLPDDRMADAPFDGRDAAPERPSSLHYAPIDHAGIRDRVAAVTAWIAHARPALMVVDVSVEIAMLARLASVPVVCVRLSGRRDDPPHREAFESAAALLAPFHQTLDDLPADPALDAKTIYTPGLVRTSERAAQPDDMTVLVVAGRGGAAADGDYWADVARAVPGRSWRIIGPATTPSDCPANLALSGWIEDAEDAVAAAGTVIGGAGDGLVCSVIAYRRPFVCMPEPRPYDEQSRKAARLGKAGAAIVIDRRPGPQEWPLLLAAAARLDPTRLADLDDADGACRAAMRLIAIADGVGSFAQLGACA